MKIRFERDGTVFEFERQPLPESRFKTVCALAAAGIYAGMVVGVAAICGLYGVVAVGVVTGLIAVFHMASF